jgi:hypothetical protein
MVYQSIVDLCKDKELWDMHNERLAQLEPCQERTEAVMKCRDVVENGYIFPILKPFPDVLPREREDHLRKMQVEFMEKLRQDGGDKIYEYETHVLHIKPERFYPVFEAVKGLRLDDALLQLRWHQKTVGLKYQSILEELIVVAKEMDYDLNKTYIAHSRINKSTDGFSKTMLNEYIKGRGRYGATPHPITTTLNIVIQERDKPFEFRVNDPLEWLRVRLRQTQTPHCPNALQVYDKLRTSRPLKAVYC